MKPTYFSDSDSLLLNEDEEFREELKEMEKGFKNDYYDPDNAALFLFLTFDKACQITMKEFQQIMKAMLMWSSAFDAVPYSDNVVVSDIPLISKFARNLNRFFIVKSISDVDILINEHGGKILYSTCITPDNPFNADEFISSVPHSLNPSEFPLETMCVEINKEPLNIIMRKDDIVSEGMGTYTNIRNEKWMENLDTWFMKGNWHCSQSYVDSATYLEKSTLPYQVIVYECLPYVKEDGDFLVETQIPLGTSSDINKFSEQTDILIFSCFCPDNPAVTSRTGIASMKFLGIYRLDKEKSQKENYISFRLIKDTFKIRIPSTHNR